jgi:hypothetical protein
MPSSAEQWVQSTTTPDGARRVHAKKPLSPRFQTNGFGDVVIPTGTAVLRIGET